MHPLFCRRLMSRWAECPGAAPRQAKVAPGCRHRCDSWYSPAAGCPWQPKRQIQQCLLYLSEVASDVVGHACRMLEGNAGTMARNVRTMIGIVHIPKPIAAGQVTQRGLRLLPIPVR